MLDRGKKKMVAVIALMKKVLMITHTLFSKNQKFDEQKYLYVIGRYNV